MLEIFCQICIRSELHLYERFIQRTLRYLEISRAATIIHLTADVMGRTEPDQTVQYLQISLPAEGLTIHVKDAITALVLDDVL